MRKKKEYAPARRDGAYGTIGETVTLKPGVFSPLARKNLAFNSRFAVNGPINGQGLPPVRDMRYGAANMVRSGCGVIAVYNALLLLDNPHRFWEVAAWGERKAAVAFGLLGTLPTKAKRLFRQLGYTVTAVTDEALFDREAQGADVCLFTYWNQRGSVRRGMHTVCLRCRAGGVEVYNLSNSCAETVRRPSLREWISSGIGPVVLYCIRK